MLPKLKDFYSKKQHTIHLLFIIYISLSSLAGSIYVYHKLSALEKSYKSLTDFKQQVEEMQSNFTQNYDDSLFSDHLTALQNQQLEGRANELEAQLTEAISVSKDANLLKITAILANYQEVLKKLNRNTAVKLDTKEISDKFADWGQKLLNNDLDALSVETTTSMKTLDTEYTKYLATIAPPPAAKSAEGYSYQTVKIDRGTFGVYLIKMPLASVKVKTVSANKETCKDNCPTKSLADYVKDAGGFAGMNGSYFCPPDYSQCSGKVNSYDYALYNSSIGKWLSKSSLGWSKTGLATFNGSSAKFYKKSTSYDGDGVSAGIVNYPALLENGNVVVNTDDLTSYQKDVKGTRGAIGVGNSNLYLALITNATIIDEAYVMRELGALNALNLDGGGSSAMYINGSYIVGPGRSLPNAIVLTK